VEDAVLSAKTPEEITRQVDAVIQKADEKLYIGKEQGRNRIVA
jgi:PleD family two-component response regulator